MNTLNTFERPDRWKNYNQAMTEQPYVRLKEFQALFEDSPLGKNEVVLDIPSFGNYLPKVLGIPNRVIAVDLFPTIATNQVVNIGDSAWELPSEPVDRIVCLAALHHIKDPASFLTLISSKLKVGGTLHVADVIPNSPESRWLDAVVTNHNATYVNLIDLKLPDNLSIKRSETKRCDWEAASEEALLRFCTLLHSAEPGVLAGALESRRQSRFYRPGRLDWFLRYQEWTRVS
jgi:hypothetical protein